MDDEYIYYIPFNSNYNSNSSSINTNGSINFSRLDMVKINIITQNNKYNGKIYIKNINRLRLMNGMGDILY